MTPAEFIAALLPAAKACEAATGIPAGFTVAQAALESAWGGSQLARMAKNLFSVKADRGWHGPVYMHDSSEVVNGNRVMLPANWRLYSTWQECIDDRSNFFRSNPRYAHCFEQKTGEGWAKAVQAAGYATDPDYAHKIIATMRAHGLG